ncbi:hypothetical protein SAMN05216419_102526 [Nitrosomonas cryotolerans]|uniref:Methanethiol oxidase n=1 Tax=Nitrosomonas cryotolerans ATCC 49181 TaxID=1131553 RepID=A0A1N6IXD3_9PROT|nr:hypothetical protein [Nitrosomonas cryotolerans]SFP85891.1 hypothetical protein SAMN05216419_102526 [Nitrosomonas cryotolerans]SIO36670.1 hypothetical protein SAMN02743940_2149 [Nitrosomonas cryotolerans ATCC 49181]
MNKRVHIYLLTLICLFILPLSSVNANTYNQYLQPLATAIDYHTRMIYLFNHEEDKVITIDPFNISGWPGDVPLQHTLTLPEGNRLYITTDNTADHPAYVIALSVNNINWDTGAAELVLDNVLAVDVPGTPAELPFVESINGKQAVPNWILAGATQIHGPTILPYSDFIYFTEWTNDRVRVINTKTNQFASVDPISIPGYTEQTHGIMFNKSGTLGLGTGYFFDNSIIDLYKVDRVTGQLETLSQIMLGNEKKHAAFSHFISWLDERYALTATMQFDKTSLTPPTTHKIIPPSVWLIDAWEGTATQIIKDTKKVNGKGIFRSASDLAVIGDKLYIAEEDTIDHTFADDGYISIFDISDRYKPRFIKRLKPGVELPQGFAVAHTLSPTPDNRYLMLASWASGYVIKIDTLTDTVVKVFGPNEGLVKPHGIHAAGGLR